MELALYTFSNTNYTMFDRYSAAITVLCFTSFITTGNQRAFTISHCWFCSQSVLGKKAVKLVVAIISKRELQQVYLRGHNYNPTTFYWSREREKERDFIAQENAERFDGTHLPTNYSAGKEESDKMQSTAENSSKKRRIFFFNYSPALGHWVKRKLSMLRGCL